eukprot:43446_1
MGNKQTQAVGYNQHELQIFSQLIDMGFNETIAMDAADKYATSFSKAIDYCTQFENTNVWCLQKNHKRSMIRNHPININDEIILYSTDSNVGEDGMVEYHVKDNTFSTIKYP